MVIFHSYVSLPEGIWNKTKIIVNGIIVPTHQPGTNHLTLIFMGFSGLDPNLGRCERKSRLRSGRCPQNLGTRQGGGG